MLVKDLTDEQLKKIAENHPAWMAKHRSEYLKKEVPAEIANYLFSNKGE